MLALATSGIICAHGACGYVNEDFRYSLVFPDGPESKVCVEDDPGGRHGAHIVFGQHARFSSQACNDRKLPSIAFGVFDNALQWKTSAIATRHLCKTGVVSGTSLRWFGSPVLKCRTPVSDPKGWVSTTLIAVMAPVEAHRDDGVMIWVTLSVPPGDERQYERTAAKIMKSFKFAEGPRGG